MKFNIENIPILGGSVRRIRTKHIPRIRYLIGLPSNQDYDRYVVNIIDTLEKLARSTLFTRKLYDQDKIVVEPEDFSWKNNLVRFISLLTMIRAFLCLIWFKDDSKSMLLGNPLHGQEFTLICLPLIMFGLFGLFFIREFVYHLEANGAISPLKLFRVIQEKGFDHRVLKLTRKKTRSFRRLFTLLVTNAPRFLLISITGISFTMIILRLFDPAFYDNGLYFSVTIIYLSTEVFIIYFVVSFIFNVAGHYFVFITWYYFRYSSLLDIWLLVYRIFTKSSSLVHPTDLSFQIRSTLECFNEFEVLTYRLRYLNFVLVFGVSFFIDSFIFMIIISQLPVQITIFALAAASFALLMISITVYATGAFIKMMGKIHRNLVKSIFSPGFNIQNKLKALEVLDRIESQYTGPYIGDFLIVRKRISIFYFLENASTIMLLICNVQLKDN